MTISRTMFLPGVLVAAQFALCGPTLAAQGLPDARMLGTTEAILDYCAKVDPAGADAFHSRARMVAQGASEESLQKVRNSDDYRQARDTTEESLAKVDQDDAVKVCAQNRPQGQ